MSGFMLVEPGRRPPVIGQHERIEAELEEAADGLECLFGERDQPLVMDFEIVVNL
jgi:hypothetical protein